ncbi:glycosyltransferase [Glaesserella parasuis]|uniref:Glycosyl transferase, group 1 n=1 Tax=Glaesserella parasuis serovar 5 (strain SH0165) TaxID=557723 RepID=B8F5N9_GLAP5|nr:glycosyltransferase [Glaesserella parasuis]ACL32641.1 glycosyl transferase, group 1 [Glaesserella parasuis SH0165]EMY45523.1 group 1 glycosyl transferase [Glaesserella parasuis gx033]MDG6247899.1 glycosyltransferase [Glaesserella parasuis]MDG6456353.1 glycosyltransferase [Glaesserella parasuis]MDG6788896.1 glycosyltransferase [Glaesserella parasuis]
MKILFLHKWLVVGGIERILINYLSILSQEENLKIDVLIDYNTKDNVFGKEIPKEINITYLFDVDYFEYKTTLYRERNNSLIKKINYKYLNIKEKIFKRKKLTNIIKNNNYDIIINFSDHFDPYIEFSKINKPIIRWQHSAIHHIDKKQLKILNQYQKIISICDDMKKAIVKDTNLPEHKIFTIYNPINIEKIRELSNTHNNEIQEKEYLIQVARLDKIKRHQDLIYIYSELVRKGIYHKLLIIGDGPERENLEQLIIKLNLQYKCLLLGELSNPYPYMRNADLFLHTSEREGLPTVLLESLVLGVPVISMDCPTGPREILDNGKCGALIEMGNTQKFIDEVLTYLNTPKRAIECKQHINQHILSFSETETKNKLITLLIELTTPGANNGN